ncbi:MAG: hypothetical protein JO346_11160 [Alphaproteobacteria bacterium]|nr:hypothetical protein [Alphaproteobacteria bacterium]
MHFALDALFAKGLSVLHLKKQPTHIVHVLGADRFADPNETSKELSHADGSKEESQEENREEEDREEGEEEEIVLTRP